jgi:hypothetical protein
VFVVGLAVLVAFGVAPFLSEQRDMPAAITSPPALENVSLVLVPPRGRVCMGGLTADPRGRQLRFKAGTYGRPGPPLALTIAGPGYRATTAIPAGWADNSTLAAPIPAPPHDELVTACIRNGGDVKVALYAAADRARSRAVVTLDGRRTAATPQFGFWEPKRVSIAARLGTIVDRIATFRGPFSTPALIWLVLLLFALGVPAALAYLLWRAFG